MKLMITIQLRTKMKILPKHVVKPYFYNVILRMIFWNMKYLFVFNCQCRRIDRNTWRSYKNIDSFTDRLPTNWHLSILNKSCKKNTEFFHYHRQLYRRTGTHQYLTKSYKKITEVFHYHRRLYQWIGTRQYLIKSWKKIIEFCHSHQRIYRQTSTCWYLTESCKKITAPAITTNGFTDR